MKTLYKAVSLLVMLIAVSYQARTQTFNYALKFNYGVVNYNNKTIRAIEKPLNAPFSLGLQFQSNLNKVFTNSFGFNTYKWADNSSYSIQNLLFLRNNAKLLNRLKPQIGFGLGFEENKTTVQNTSLYKQYVFVPLNIGLQTDLTERISLGIFGEIKYGFDFRDFDINEGSILPNN
ncbi:MAG TPA: hypothetical protein VFM79_09990, partial [Pelobium sp.]|nr:hypothetical protein [Pelobium sp.]